jgi:hypothetical protein
VSYANLSKWPAQKDEPVLRRAVRAVSGKVRYPCANQSLRCENLDRGI